MYLLNKKFSAGYTVEASYIMAMVLLSLSVLIRSGYTKYKEETGIMRLHHVVEQLRGQEKEEDKVLNLGEWNIEAGRFKTKAEGTFKDRGRQKKIQAGVHEPENMMRLLTVFQPNQRESRSGNE